MFAKVLVVDDAEDFRWLFTTLLQQNPIVGELLEAADGLAAIDVVRRERPDLVVIDLMMPRLDGFEATRRIKREWPATKVIVVTSVADALFQSKAAAVGADAFLDKLDATTMLPLAVQRLLEGTEVERPAGAMAPPPDRSERA